MFRNQYDTDVTVWSPQGRLHQAGFSLYVVGGAFALPELGEPAKSFGGYLFRVVPMLAAIAGRWLLGLRVR